MRGGKEMGDITSEEPRHKGLEVQLKELNFILRVMGKSKGH